MTTPLSMVNRHHFASPLLAMVFAIILLASCKKTEDDNVQKPKASAHTAEVLDKWMTLQQRLMRNATGIPNHGLARHFAYAGVAALEALKPGLNGPDHWSDQWNGLSGLPLVEHWKTYYYPANVNAAMAAINKAMFPGANAVDKAAIDSLESALTQSFASTQSTEVLTTSATFGKAVASAVFDWSETDGYKNANAPYSLPTGDGAWKPTPPANAAPATPYWGLNRPVIYNSTANSQPSAPLTYSTDPQSAFFKMVKQVYDVSQTLTEEQKAIALFWRDVPGATTPGHWLSIVQQAIRQSNASLDKAALAYALTGIAINDALISCFKTKYQYTLLRPVTYIREVMGHTTWSSFIGTPAHPEYSSAHASLSTAAAIVLQKLFGNIGSITDHTNDYLGYAPRTYSSFTAIGEEASISRLYAGIHYLQSIEAAEQQGRKVAQNILGQHGNYLPASKVLAD